jgi:DNA-binding NtrC family response regulator
MNRRYRILIIDDEQSVADALGIILNDLGYDTCSALTGRDGVRQARDGGFDFVITDLRLPDMSGLDVLDHLRHNNSTCRSVLITCYGTPEIAAEAINRGALAVLAKPFTPSELISLISTALESDSL